MNILIVGGLGYLGSRLALHLNSTHNVVVTTRLLSRVKEEWAQNNSISVILYNVLYDNPNKKYDIVVNMAMPSAQEVEKDYGKSLKLALANINLCKKLVGDTTSLIHTSTFHVYGTPISTKTYNELTLPAPEKPYANLHLECEKLLRDSTNTTILRLTNIVGSPAHSDVGVQSSLIFLDLCKQAVVNNSIILKSTGQGYRDFLPISDFLSAFAVIMQQENRNTTCTYNISSGNTITLIELAYIVKTVAQNILQKEIKIETGSYVDLTTSPFIIDNSKISSLGWKQISSIEYEIAQILKFWKEQIS